MTLQEQSWTKQCRIFFFFVIGTAGWDGAGTKEALNTIYMTKSSSQEGLDM